MKQGPVIVLERCGCMVDHGIPYRCPQHQLLVAPKPVAEEDSVKSGRERLGGTF